MNLQNTKLFISAGELRQFPSHPVPQVALSGRSNVGKSSLINTVLGRKSLARRGDSNPPRPMTAERELISILLSANVLRIISRRHSY